MSRLWQKTPPAFGKTFDFGVVGGDAKGPDLSNMGHVRMIKQRAALLAEQSNLSQKSESLARLRSDLAALQGPAKEGDEKKSVDPSDFDES